MNRWTRYILCALLVSQIVWLGSGCLGSGGGGGGGVSNDDPGDNDVNTYVAQGDSITAGSECSCPPYPARLAGLLGKTVVNSGQPAETSGSGAARAGSVLSKYKPGFLLVLYGVNDIIHGASSESAAANVRSIVQQAKANKTVPVVATYPIPVGPHGAFSGGTSSLNSLLRDMAGSEGVALVDLENEFEGSTDLLEPDGLHPNDLGTEVMALAFFDKLN